MTMPDDGDLALEYPISEEARERISSARARSLAFELRRVFTRGGYPPEEVDAIADVFLRAVNNRPQLNRGQVAAELWERGVRNFDELAEMLVSVSGSR